MMKRRTRLIRNSCGRMVEKNVSKHGFDDLLLYTQAFILFGFPLRDAQLKTFAINHAVNCCFLH